MSDRDVLDMDLEENEEKELLDDDGPEDNDRKEIEDLIENDIQDALDNADSDNSDDEMEKLRAEALSKFNQFNFLVNYCRGSKLDLAVFWRHKYLVNKLNERM